jgi:hypothetical protein
MPHFVRSCSRLPSIGVDDGIARTRGPRVSFVELEPGEVDGSPPLIAHLERYLGRIEVGSRVESAEEGSSFQIIRHEGNEFWTAYSTLGVSAHLLATAEGKTARFEFMTLAQKPGQWAVSCLADVAEWHLGRHQGPRRGEVFGPAGPLVPGSQMEAFYVASPVYFDDAFAECDEADGPIVIVWLVPITAAEASYIRAVGWHRWEDELVVTDPDLTSLDRPSLH